MAKYVLDSNCYIDATKNAEDQAALEHFVTWAAPQLYLSTVVAAELRAGARSPADRLRLEELVLRLFVRRQRIITPTAAAWDALGHTLATLGNRPGLEPQLVRRGFAFDILLASSARKAGAAVVTRNRRNMERTAPSSRSTFSRPTPSARRCGMTRPCCWRGPHPGRPPPDMLL